MLVFLAIGMLALSFEVQQARASGTGTIYINADGSITPSTAPISTVDNVTYTLNGDVGQMVVERNNIIIDGANHTVFSNETNYGILLNETSNVTVENMQVTAQLAHVAGKWLALDGIRVYSCLNVSITGNTFMDTVIALGIVASNETKVSGNTIFKSDTASSFYGVNLVCEGISLIESSGSIISDNIMTKVDYAVETGYGSYGNYLYNNTVTQSKYGFVFSNLSNSWASNPIGTDNISTSNTVDGRPVYYWVDRQDSQVPSDAGDIILTNCQNITMANLNLTSNMDSMLLVNTTNSFITQSPVTNSGDGILLINCYNITIAGLNLTSNSCSLDFQGTTGSVITENFFGSSQVDIRFLQSSGNTIYRNQFDNPAFSSIGESPNHWDNGYPSGGNYWAKQAGGDLYSGPYQNQTGSDGIRDTPYIVDANNTDHYPLMAQLTVYDAGTWNGAAYKVEIESNSTVSNMQIDMANKTVSFNVTGSESTKGFCRIAIPNVIVQDLWHGDYVVILNDEPWSFQNWTDATNAYIYINYTHSEHTIVIVPEFPPVAALPLFTGLSVLVAVFTKKRARRKTGI